MRSIVVAVLSSVAAIGSLQPAAAWWDEGHMQVAYLAYQRLDPAVKEKADALLKLNPDYSKWVAGAPDAATARLYAFIHAATWADDIKNKDYGYTADKVTSPTAGQNIGYADHNQHAYWHYKDLVVSPDGLVAGPPDPVDAVTQLKRMIAALPPASGASDDVRSYDLVWTLHLVGDVHQPLHAVTRFTHELPDGDQGGNLEMVIPATGQVLALHAYWDGLLGSYASPYGAAYDAKARDGAGSITPNAGEASIEDPDVWVNESRVLAEKYAYAPPVGTGPNPVMLTRTYETDARNIALSQVALAGARLGNLLNKALK